MTTCDVIPSTDLSATPKIKAHQISSAPCLCATIDAAQTYHVTALWYWWLRAGGRRIDGTALVPSSTACLQQVLRVLAHLPVL
eukprot:1159006-Pelagomonas_calceolata.AAC.5